MTRDEYVDALARQHALRHFPGANWEKYPPSAKAKYRKWAAETLLDIATLAARGGPKLVAREPTREMIEAAAWYEMPGHGPRANAEVFAKMHDAAHAVPGDDA